MTEKQSHYGCKYYILQYDECLKFHESNMSQRIKLCECSMRVGDLMTERFTIRPQNDYFGVYDNLQEMNVVSGIPTGEAKWLCGLLNDLYGETVELKKELLEVQDITNLKKIRDESEIWDSWELIKPVANMVLWNWGLKLLGNNDPYNLTCFDTEKFEKKLIETIKNNKMI